MLDLHFYAHKNVSYPIFMRVKVLAAMVGLGLPPGVGCRVDRRARYRGVMTTHEDPSVADLTAALPLHHQVIGAPAAAEAPPLLMLHGLFGSASNWRTLGRRLADRRAVLAADLRNHGESPWCDTMAYVEMAADVRRLLDTLGCSQVDLLGHSMGGKAAMVFALCYPQRVRRLVVVDIAPVAYSPKLLAYVRAMQAVDLGRGATRGQADRQLAGEIASPAVRAFLLQNLRRAEGGLRWRVNLAALGAEMPVISGFPDAVGQAAFTGRTLFVYGLRSDYVQPSMHAGIRALFPQARLHGIVDAGHWVHAEQPDALLAAVARFLSAL